MKKPEVILRPKAREDIAEIGAYIGLDNPEAGAAFRQTLQNFYEMLADLPEIGSARNFGNPELEGLCCQSRNLKSTSSFTSLF